MERQKTIALLLAGTALAVSPVLAQQVGTATAVNPESQSTPPGGGATATLKVGARIAQGADQNYAYRIGAASFS